MKPDSRNDAFLAGKHCQLEYCNQLDFLPFKCQSCAKTFCQEHRAESAHKCANEGAWGERRRLAELQKPAHGAHRPVRDRHQFAPGTTCGASDCDKGISSTDPGKIGVHCDTCRGNYCLKHRIPEDHDCKSRTAEARKARDKLGVESALDNFKTRWQAWKLKKMEQEKASSSSSGLKKLFAPKKPSAAAQRVKLMTELRAKAKGDTKLPQDKRIYVVVASSEKDKKGEYPRMMAFYSKDWVVGRLLDAAAKDMGVDNSSLEGQERLTVWSVEGEKFLPLNDKIGESIKTGEKVVLTRGGNINDEVIARLME